MDNGAERFVSIDQTTGDCTEITTFENTHAALALTGTEQDVFMVVGDALFRVNLDSGEQSLVSGTHPDSGDVTGFDYILSDTKSSHLEVQC